MTIKAREDSARNTCNLLMPGMAALAIGAVLAAPAAGAPTLTTLYHFTGQQDGGNPHCVLLLLGGLLYGTTEIGGASGAGTVFEIDPATGKESVLYSFTGGDDGGTPTAGLVYEGGLFYGTTSAGGTSGVGTVFSFDPATGAESVVHNFTGFADGDMPFAGLVDHKGTLYGTTPYGGNSGGGTVYAVDIATGTEKVLYGFGGFRGDGNEPMAPLTYKDGVLYGTTMNGGFSPGTGELTDAGTVFAVNAATGSESILYSFDQDGGQDGINPWGGVIFRGSELYGTTYYGYNYEGRSYYGTVYSLDPSNGREGIVYAFHGDADGGFPFAGVLSHGADLYGIGSFSGQGNCGGSGCGVVFKVDPGTQKETVLHSFTGHGDGGNPESGLIYANGAYYGATFDGGKSNAGTVFKLVP
jgi:uncharacterized repeat protein (TIGR03803 family)